MSDTPVVGITTYGRDERGRFTLPGEYVDSVRRAGARALTLTPGDADPEGTLAEGQSRTRHAWVESGAGAWSLMDYEPFMDLHRHLIGSD